MLSEYLKLAIAFLSCGFRSFRSLNPNSEIVYNCRLPELTTLLIMTNKSMTKKNFEFDSEREFHKLYAEEPKNLQLMEESLGCKVVARGTCLTLEGKEQSVQQGEVLFRLLEQAKKQGLATKKF